MLGFLNPQLLSQENRDHLIYENKGNTVNKRLFPLMRTLAAHGSDSLMKVLPLSVCAMANTNVDGGLDIAVGLLFPNDERSCVEDGEAGEAPHHQNISFLC